MKYRYRSFVFIRYFRGRLVKNGYILMIPAFLCWPTPKSAKTANKPQKFTDSNGLYLLINPTGSKLWSYRFRLGGKKIIFAIGAYPAINLAQACAARDAARELVKQGINPAHNRASMLAEQIANKHNTFSAIAEEFIASKQGKSQTYINGIRRDFKTTFTLPSATYPSIPLPHNR